METEDLAKSSLSLAQELQEKALKSGNSTFSRRLKPLLVFPTAKAFLIRLLDVAFRSDSYAVVARFVRKLFASSQSHTVLFSEMEQGLIQAFVWIGHRFPNISIPIMRDRISHIAKSVVYVHKSGHFHKHALSRKTEGIALNINLIGEALMGEAEAEERIDKYRKLLHEPTVDYISVKISTIYSQIDSLAYEDTLAILNQRLAILYQELLLIHEQTGQWKFINLDMEEYRDLSLTVDTFTQTLSKPEFLHLSAGIVLQAYIPDSYTYLVRLQQWAQKRQAAGGACIKIRIVKGANMEMEKTESSLQGWPTVTFDQKVDTDANYKKMLLTLLQPTSSQSIRVGIASHNIFDLAFAITLTKQKGLQQAVDIEMLEGMAGSLPKIILNEGMKVLLYTPLVEEKSFMSAIAYLVRRLDEGTADGNFLKEGFELNPRSPKWLELEAMFMESVKRIPALSNIAKRHQDRNLKPLEIQNGGFINEPDTDWVLPQNRAWLQSLVRRWQHTKDIQGETFVPVSGKKRTRKLISQNNWQGSLPWQYELADAQDYRETLALAKASSWFTLSHEQRIQVIREAALQIQQSRGDLIGIGMAEVGKLVKELDPEISEAIDFANYYAYNMEQLLAEPGITYEPGGVHLVLPPWNFPIAIPAGGVLASLVSGHAVILKPALNAAACSYLLCKALWQAGIPQDALFFLPTEEQILDEFLGTGQTFDAVILTGGTETAQILLDRNPRLNLFAETGGKNATIVTALADREQAIKHVIQSAFGNAGQKCSATSLLILLRDVYEDENFKNLLKDALQSKKVGSPWEMDTQIGPLAVPLTTKLQKMMQRPASDWLIQPKIEGQLMSPGVLWGVSTLDWEYRQELFGPVVCVMVAETLQEAIELVNNVDFALTSGLESLDEDEIETWKNLIHVGNLYVNRSTTGAIVQRQPFGGLKSSCFGFGMKAGGKHYLQQFLKPKVVEVSTSTVPATSLHLWALHLGVVEMQHLNAAFMDYTKAYEQLFSKENEDAHIRGQYNHNKYLKPEKVLLCVDEQVPLLHIAMVYAACEACGLGLEIYSLHTLVNESLYNALGLTCKHLSAWEDLDMTHSIAIRALNKSRLPDTMLRKAHKKAIHLYGDTPSCIGVYELLNYFTEQNISYNYHRYGNLMGKE